MDSKMLGGILFMEMTVVHIYMQSEALANCV